jgi:hypothetical protein
MQVCEAVANRSRQHSSERKIALMNSKIHQHEVKNLYGPRTNTHHILKNKDRVLNRLKEKVSY